MGETTKTAQQVDDLEDSDIMDEIDRVLENQFSVIQEQQSQATKLIRVSLTITGLFLSVISIAASQLNPEEIVADISPSSTQLTTLSSLISLILIILVSRGLLPALAVLRPELTGGTVPDLLYAPIMRNEEIGKNYKEKLEQEDLPTEIDSDFFDKEITFRYGVDAEKASSLFNADNKKSELVKYKIGCLFGNQILIEENRTHLSTVYRSASVVTLIIVTVVGYFVTFYYSYTQSIL